MLKVILTCGIPASGKSTWAKEELRKDNNLTRINRDDLRAMMHNSLWSQENEKLVISTRDYLMSQSLRKGRSVILDDTNLNPRNFDEICEIVTSLNLDVMVMEKPFYIELDEAIARDSARSAKVGEEVIRKFWKQSGGKIHQFYKARVKMCTRKVDSTSDTKLVDNKLPWAVICDLDGTLSLFNAIKKDGTVLKQYEGVHARSPYDASKADEDALNEPVGVVLEALHKQGYKIIFCSGREDCYRNQTVSFIEKHLDLPYELFMRKTGDQRKDAIIKEEIYRGNISPNYNIFVVLDDRSQVVSKWRELGLTCFQVAPGDF